MPPAPRLSISSAAHVVHKGLTGVAAASLALAGLAMPTPALAATFTVLNTNDAGAGSLRQALLDSATGDTITFSVPSASTITLVTELPAITHDLTITGPGAADLTITGGDAVGILTVGGGAAVTVSGLRLEHGKRATGGAVISAGTLTAEDLVFAANTTTGASSPSRGGAISSTGTLIVVDSTFDGNVAYVNLPVTASEGGAIAATGPVTITGSTFVDNGAYGAGSVYAEATAAITNSTFSASIGTVDGGAIIAAAGTLTNVTVAGTLTSGAAVKFEGDAVLVNTVIAGTAALGMSSVADCGLAAGASLVTDDHNFIADGSCATGSLSRLSGDPLLGALAANGGPTRTMLPGLGSPLIDAGANETCPTTDQRGVTRPASVANPCDIGAVDLDLPDPLATSTSTQVSRSIVSPGVTISDTATVVIDAVAPTRVGPLGGVSGVTGSVTFSYCFAVNAAPVSCTDGTHIGDPIDLGTPDVDGTATAMLTGWVPPDGIGYYLLHAAYSGDDTYAASEDDGTNEQVEVVIGRVPRVTVDPISAPAGATVEACVVFFLPGSEVTFALATTEVTATVGGDGSVCVDLVVPSGVTGAIDVEVTGTDENELPIEASQAVIVMPASDATTATAATGSQFGPILLVALGLLLSVGGLTMTLARGRRTA